MLYTKISEDEIKEFADVYLALAKVIGEKIKEVELSEVIAHLLGEIMKGVDKACGNQKKAHWTREEVFRLLEVLKPNAKSQGPR